MSDTPSSLLLRSHFETLTRVSQVLSRSLDFHHSLREVLRTLEITGHLSRGMISVVDPGVGDPFVHAVHGLDYAEFRPVRYQPGEGLIGTILEERRPWRCRAWATSRVSSTGSALRPDLPFIAVPISVGGTLQGVLAVQPDDPDDGLLAERAALRRNAGQPDRPERPPLAGDQKERKSLDRGTRPLRRSVRHRPGFANLVGHSVAMLRIFDQIRMVAKWPTTVLIRGETGTGKELIANAIHYNSPRARGPYVRLNCASLPENLLESELFGHEKGAFTGAVNSRKGRFEMADGGTLFLDEIGEISPAFQAKLLRVLQEGELERVGGGRTLKLDVRLIAATHRDLEARRYRRLPRGPVLPPQRHAHRRCPRCANARRPAEDRQTPARSPRRHAAPPAAPHRRSTAAPHASTTGRATCANWKTAWSALP
jgi:Nif-specific regulatory protein